MLLQGHTYIPDFYFPDTRGIQDNEPYAENQKRKLEGYEAEHEGVSCAGSERTQKEARRRLPGVQKYTQIHDSAGRSCEIAYNLVPKGRKVYAPVRI